MEKDLFKKTPIAAAVALALGGAPVVAEEADTTAGAAPSTMEEIVVTGIRGSLIKSMDRKRYSEGVVDAITAEDIGDFPDTNLAESLQRITGVSIDRERGEGARVTVRGFGPEFNLVLLNGRQMPVSCQNPSTCSLSRSFDFGNLASEGISAVEVHKTAEAGMPTGGIGATINVRTTRPLENPGLSFTVAGSGMHDDSSEEGSEYTPEVSALFSNTFADDRFGVALSAVRQERDSGAATASVGGWRTFSGVVNNSWGSNVGVQEWGGIPIAADPNQVNRPDDGDLYSVPQNIGYELAEYERTRTNGQLTLQWQATDQIRATLDYTYSEVELQRTFNNMSAWFNFGAQETVFTDGPQASPIEYTENLGGSDYAMAAGADAWRTENDSVGFNLVWDVNEKLSLEFDYHDSTAEFEPDSPFGSASQLAISSFTRDRTSGYFGSDLPILELGLSRPLSADDMIVTGSVFVNDQSRMDIEQTRLTGNYEFDASFVKGIDFGIELTEVNNKSQNSVVQRDAWGGVTQPGAIADLLTPASTRGRFDEISGSSDGRRQTDFFTFDMESLIARTQDLIASGQATLFAPGGGDFGPCGTGLCASPTFTSDRRTEEESTAAYVQARMEGEIAGKPIGLRVGLRYEDTDVTSRALSPTYTGIRQVSGNEFSLIQGDQAFATRKGSYDLLLPSLDFRIDLTDDVVGRFSYSKTITRPNYRDIQGGLTLDQLARVDGGNGSRGDPTLEPMEADNYDLSFEWYYAEDSYVSVGYFVKDVKNFIGTAESIETPFNLAHPAFGPLYDEARAATGSVEAPVLFNWILANRPDAEGVDAASPTPSITGVAGRDGVSPFSLTVPVNSEEIEVDGWEINVQHNFGESGFGIIANYTIVDADKDFDNFALSDQFAIYGLSDSANVIGFYEKHGFGIRVAWNWRDDFLAGEGQNNVGPLPPTYTDEYQQLDLSANYWINDNAQVFVDVLNITNETTYVYGRDEQQTLFAGQLGTRYNVGFRYKF